MPMHKHAHAYEEAFVCERIQFSMFSGMHNYMHLVARATLSWQGHGLEHVRSHQKRDTEFFVLIEQPSVPISGSQRHISVSCLHSRPYACLPACFQWPMTTRTSTACEVHLHIAYYVAHLQLQLSIALFNAHRLLLNAEDN